MEVFVTPQRPLCSVTAIGLALVCGTAQAISTVDIAGQAGMPRPLPTMEEGLVFKQYGDGDFDLVLSGHGQEWPLLRQGPARKFAHVLAGTFSARQDRYGCTTADFNRDSLPDAYCVRGACKPSTNNYPNELYLGRSDRTFAKIAGAEA